MSQADQDGQAAAATHAITADLLLKLYQAVRTSDGCLACDRNHVDPTALAPPVYCACPCHPVRGMLHQTRLLVEPAPRRRATDRLGDATR